jgi:hypothetical protein
MGEDCLSIGMPYRTDSPLLVTLTDLMDRISGLPCPDFDTGLRYVLLTAHLNLNSSGYNFEYIHTSSFTTHFQ